LRAILKQDAPARCQGRGQAYSDLASGCISRIDIHPTDRSSRMTKLKPSRRWLLGAAILGVPTLLAGWKAQRLAAAPDGPKDCGPIVEAGAPPASPGEAANLPWAARGGTINDVSCLSRTAVAGILRPTSDAEIAAAIAYARRNGLTLSMAGARHSMGGHAFAKGGLVLDMTGFNKVTLNEAAGTITVQSGATWHDIQNAIHPRFAVKAMQSSDVFTVGGSISVNAHGMDHQVGAIERTIRSFRLIKANGEIVRLSRNDNADLYRLVVGGYGMFGVILDVELEVTENRLYRSQRRLIDYREFPRLFAEEIEPDRSIALFYGHLSTAPGKSFLRETLLYSYHDVGGAEPSLPPLGDVSSIGLRRLIFNLAKEGPMFARMKWYAEKRLEHFAESCSVRRADAQGGGELCLVSRNEPMHDAVPYLFNALDDETDILHEYFLPRDRLIAFIDEMRVLMEKEETNLLNASIRVVHKEDIALNYAPEDAFSLVLYVNQTTDAEGTEKMRRLTGALIDLAHKHGGRFFLPYQIHYDPAQLKRAYPQIGDIFAAKRKYDPDGLFSNRFYETFSGQV
jgi:FAD/FMN-containing dehydrogenase